MNYRVLRAVSATDDTGLAADGVDYDSIKDSLVGIKPGQRGEVTIIFKGTDANNETLNWNLFAVKGVGSPAEQVAYGTAILGATQTGETNEFYADTIAITGQKWLRTVSAIQGLQYNLGTGAVSGAGIAKLTFDSMEYEYLYMLMSKGTCATCGADFALTY